MYKEQEDKEVLVKVEGLSKKFCKDLKTSLWYGVKDLLSGIRGSQEERQLRPKEFWAVKDIDFELRRGECLGLIGHNGAGKSTLLKILNGLINPDAGSVTIRGRVGALIELGAGFNPILTGRENIYNNGAVLGFSRKEIDSKLEAIIAFAELDEFIDMPVQHYSSGMKVRLGFAVAAQMEPDVLIIDEVLAVGDMGFILKCFKTIDTILPHTAVIFVSHNMPLVSRICNKILLMDHGEAKFFGSGVSKGLDLYYNYFASNDINIVFDDGSFKLEVIEICKYQSKMGGVPQLNWNDDFRLYFRIKELKKNPLPFFKIIITDIECRPIAIFDRNKNDSGIISKNGIIEFYITHNNIQLSKGVYNIDLGIFNQITEEPYLRINQVAVFQVNHEEDIWTSFLLKSEFATNESFKE